MRRSENRIRLRSHGRCQCQLCGDLPPKTAKRLSSKRVRQAGRTQMTAEVEKQ